MSTLPVWATDPGALLITEEGYAALPEEIQRQIEVVDGHVLVCRSGTFEHNNVARRMANAFEQASPDEPCTGVVTDFEMHSVRSRPGSPGFSFRRPDVAWYRCIDGDRKLTTADVLLVVEVVSPGSEYTDTWISARSTRTREFDLFDRASGRGSQSQDNPGISSRLGEP
ncbi:Uma2 family endonuclease [Nocardia barduliensis]|uniref:Uma2 family endonuclease n=1 Tax=Nocardia barduliensis TaxID=2736643 RepID=UPI001FE5B546|nr:Uma2 family endonuclease [Nocardia barduliensis]